MFEEEVCPCLDSCGNSNASASCEQEPRPGCVCPDGHLWSGPTCVAADECGCVTEDNEYYPV